ncbi:hypothetical protein [Desulfurobacterium atlanticum]|uniref:Uncharacterized protein n=1 Tax=Desulfurobacterium atlanticum TaxID=240169 RepID=A0A238Y4H7_9BACT|nr:hypothetical protein [Desulfurobacterium atlanticum]SNR66027.1 hypothetical protein SAMN06265340_102108 [Desulfurobacterium atlanticum]
MKTIAFLTLDIPALPKADFPVNVEFEGNRVLVPALKIMNFIDTSKGLKLIDHTNKVQVYDIKSVEGNVLNVEKVATFENRRKSIRLPFIGRYKGFFVSAINDVPDVYKLRDISFEAIAVNPIGDAPVFPENKEINGRLLFPAMGLKSPVLPFYIIRATSDIVVFGFEGKTEFAKELMLNLTVELKHLLKTMEIT